MSVVEHPTEYLSKALAAILPPDTIDAIVEYLASFDLTSEKNDVVSYLEGVSGADHQVIEEIIANYIDLQNSTSMIPLSSENITMMEIEPQTIDTINKIPTKKQFFDESAIDCISFEKVGLTSCRCMATRHPFYSSCVSCGWISCEKDASTHCSMCGTKIIPPMTAEAVEAAGFDEDTVKAYKQKDKLLLFDKENTKRTHVHDAQGDYYSSNMWLTSEEKKEVIKREKKRRELRQKSTQRKVNVSFDIAGRKIVEYIDGVEEDELKLTNEDGQLEVQLEDEDYVEEFGANPSILKGYSNLDLEYSSSAAGELYRNMKKGWKKGKTDNNGKAGENTKNSINKRGKSRVLHDPSSL